MRVNQPAAAKQSVFSEPEAADALHPVQQVLIDEQMHLCGPCQTIGK